MLIVYLIISVLINILLTIILILNSKPNDWNAVYNLHYKLDCRKIGSGYPTWVEEHHITILYSESRNRYKITSSDISYKTREQYNKIIEMLNQYNKK